MRRLTLAVLLALAAGCGSSDKKGDNAAPPPSSSASTAPAKQPAAQPQPAAKTPPASEPASSGDEQIVIKGSKHKDSGSSSAGSSDRQRQAKIDELNAKARESQGKDNGTPLKASSTGDAAAVDNDVKKERLRAEIADKDSQIAKLQEEKASHTSTSVHRQGAYKVEEKKVDDPERVKAIDAEIESLKAEKLALQKKLTALDAPATTPAGGDQPR